MLRADPNSAEWKDYLNYVDEAVKEGMYNAVYRSLQYIVLNTGNFTIFAVKLYFSIQGKKRFTN